MSYSPELRRRAQQIVDDRRVEAKTDADRREADFSALESRYAPLAGLIRKTAHSTVNALTMEPGKAQSFLEELSVKNLAAQEEVKKLLAEHGLPENWLEPRYTCPLCNDRGNAGGRVCVCYKTLLRELAYKDAGRITPFQKSSFDEFSLDFYPDRPTKNGRTSVRAQMASVFDYCKSYAENFRPSFDSLLFTGDPGLGKTFLSLCIADTVIDRGFTVLYAGCPDLADILNDARFGKGADDPTDLIADCDLFILDDLGAEFSTQFSQAALGSIISNRLAKNASTIISTNLTPAQIETKYPARLASRVLGEYRRMSFEGDDIRRLDA
ncbi:MAG: ATP-binding protein [Clostridia bacterium]|nr:ATP-binding protein [Clostridia bacterium]